jgi:ubiquinone/menaquinone biosynthesis C-methylase UbiE
MSNFKPITWRDIWLKKGSTVQTNGKEKQELINLIKFDGFDTGGGSVNEETWLKLVDLVEKKIQLKKNFNIIEVGCGAGAFLYPFYQQGIYNIYGIDYSESLIKIAKEVMPKANLICAEAKSLPFEKNLFDVVVSNSVFNYFPNEIYAKDVLFEILRVLKSGGECLLLDLNDLAKKDYAEKKRRDELGVEEYEKRYKNLSQMYYDKDWFKNFALQNNLEFEIFDQKITEYGNSEWRFNFYFKNL